MDFPKKINPTQMAIVLTVTITILLILLIVYLIIMNGNISRSIDPARVQIYTTQLDLEKFQQIYQKIHQ